MFRRWSNGRPEFETLIPVAFDYWCILIDIISHGARVVTKRKLASRIKGSRFDQSMGIFTREPSSFIVNPVRIVP